MFPYSFKGYIWKGLKKVMCEAYCFWKDSIQDMRKVGIFYLLENLGHPWETKNILEWTALRKKSVTSYIASPLCMFYTQYWHYLFSIWLRLLQGKLICALYFRTTDLILSSCSLKLQQTHLNIFVVFIRHRAQY